MKRTVIAGLTIGLLLANAPGRSEELAVGLILAEPTGLSAKYWLNDEQAIDAAAAWAFSGEDALQLHADWLMHRYDLLGINTPEGRAPLYFGLGARLKLKDDKGRDDDALGIRVPVGVTFLFAQAPFDLFAEIVPVLDIAPDTDLDLNLAVGGRFYFGDRVSLLR